MVVALSGSLIFLGIGVRLNFIKLSIFGNENRRRVDFGNLINAFTLLFFFWISNCGDNILALSKIVTITT
ncbi:MAG: hypothetical protein WCF46_13220 [Nitrososphaeraceae archaeon]